MSFSIDPKLARFLPPEAELSEQFIRSSGPGGQHVNRTETGVQLRFDALGSEFLSEPVRGRLVELAGKRADGDGVILIEATSHRSQYRNREAARQRLAELIERAHRRPRKRIATRPSRTAKKKRLEAKRQRGRIKRKRGKPSLDE
ncbi:MAG: alternative ribosome rescue aminoacyl-tRNA hydrolase ArfB [Wenzhouxiangella sp.]|jgi:ribosome-associated protein|nr:alternative ribosome rescue aminoacyl-tRNA hydrolase ArfB [Wenzhouxiangella sp.]